MTKRLSAKRLVAVLLLVAGFLLQISLQRSYAGGITLYSYQDDEGRTIVVDSPEKIPVQFRDKAESSYIPSFSGAGKKKKSTINAESKSEYIEEAEAEADNTVVNDSSFEQPAVIDLNAPVVQAPPAEIPKENPAVATASLLMEQILAIQLNYERLQVHAARYGIKHPSIRHFHLMNIQALQGVISPESIDWEAALTWKKRARAIIEQLQTLKFTLSHWIDSSSGAIIHALPPLLVHIKVQIVELENDFGVAMKEENLRLQKGSPVIEKK